MSVWVGVLVRACKTIAFTVKLTMDTDTILSAMSGRFDLWRQATPVLASMPRLNSRMSTRTARFSQSALYG